VSRGLGPDNNFVTRGGACYKQAALKFEDDVVLIRVTVVVTKSCAYPLQFEYTRDIIFQPEPELMVLETKEHRTTACESL
jgi:hypothetical protein